MRRLLLCLLVAIPLHTQAADYYLAPNGSDANPCSASAPCTSLTTLLPKLSPGDRGLLKGGTYAQALKLGNPPVRPGTPTQPITLASAPGEQAVIQPTSGVEAVTINGNTQYWVLEDLTVDGSKLSHATSTVNAVSINWRSGPMNSPQATSFITLRRLTIRDVRNPAGSNSVGLSIGANDNLIENVVIDGTHLQAGDRQGSHGIYLALGSRNRIVGGKVTNTGGCGVQLNDSSHEPAGNRDNVVMGVWIEANGNRTTGGGACGLTVYHNMQNTRVVSNLIVNNRGAGILHEGGNNTGSVIAHNTIAGNQAACLTAGNDASHPSMVTTIQNNICANNGSGMTLGAFATDNAVVANVLSDKSAPSSAAGDLSGSANLVGVDPQFVDASARNYRLQASSPACGSGQALVPVRRNAWGQAYGEPPDRGVYPCAAHPDPGPEPPEPPTHNALHCEGGVESVPGALTMTCVPVSQ